VDECDWIVIGHSHFDHLAGAERIMSNTNAMLIGSYESVRVMEAADWHTYQVLTKRSERLCELLNGKLRFAADRENIWWGVSVEDRKHGLPRVAHLQQARAKVRFLSIEPLLEDLGRIDLSGINWVIVGGESGPGARPMDKEWVLSIREQCRSHGIPFVLKQWGRRTKKEEWKSAGGADLR